jgi:hypothetical protein
MCGWQHIGENIFERGCEPLLPMPIFWEKLNAVSCLVEVG